MPLISAVIPAYNPGGYLARSVGSVLSQTCKDVECIVVDDGSGEDLRTLAILDNPRVRYHRQSNRGVSVARNVGVSLSGGKYVAFLDQDDEWSPWKLELQLESLMVNPKASFSHTPFVWALPGEDRHSEVQHVSYERSLAGRGGLVCLSSLMVERAKHDAVGGHDPLLTQQQDWDFVLKLLRVFGLPTTALEPLVRYYVHGSNASVDYWTAEREARMVLGLHAAIARRTGDLASLRAIRSGRKVTRKNHGHQAIDQARASYRARDWRAASLHLRRGFALQPLLVAQAGLSTATKPARWLSHRSVD